MWEIDPGLPADKAGMKAGDRLVAVAGESVEGLGHEETVSRIRAQGSCVSLIVVDPELFLTQGLALLVLSQVTWLLSL